MSEPSTRIGKTHVMPFSINCGTTAIPSIGLTPLACSRKYNKSLENTNNKTDLKKIWQDDPKEVARRVWQWWVANNGNFHYLSIAVRLIVLVQTSSASAERAFSQLGLILDGLGNCALDDVVELRLFERVNREKYQA
jgi:hypothetical protein